MFAPYLAHLKQIGDRLTRPHPDLPALVRGRVRILSALSLGFLFLYLLPEVMEDLPAALISDVGTLLFSIGVFLVYLLSRSRYGRWGIWLFLLLFLGNPVREAVRHGLFSGVPPMEAWMNGLGWIFIPPALGVLLLTPWEMLFLNLVAGLLLWLAPGFFPELAVVREAILLEAFTVMTVLLWGASFIRHRDMLNLIHSEERIRQERNYLQTVINALQDPFYVLDAGTYEVILANDAARSRGVRSARTCYALTHHRDTPCSGLEHPCPLQHVVQHREPFTVEHIHYYADGTPYYAEVHGYPVRDENGQVIQMVEYSLDITERKKADETIRQLQRAIEHAATGVVITGTDGTIQYVNPAFTRMTGYSAAEAVGQNPRLLKSGKHRPKFYTALWETITKGKVWRGEMINRRKDGTFYWEFQTIAPVIDSQGQITHFVAVKEDVTRRKEMEAALRQARDEARQASEFKSRLLANISHDMRTPLGAIIGYAEMLADGALGPVTEKQQNVLRTILNAGQTLTDFTTNLVHQAELESGKIRFKPKAFHIQELCKIISVSEAVAESKGVQVEYSIHPDLPDPLVGDVYWLRQILGNLLSNAVKFTDEGRISVSFFPADGNRWAIQVQDTGKGISPEAQSKIFEPFVQEDGAFAHGGSGLGLAIVHQLVQMMGGEIVLESQPGQGSTFTVYLPVNMDIQENPQDGINIAL